MSNIDPTKQPTGPQGPSYYNMTPPPPPVPGPKQKMGKGKKWAIGLGAVLALGAVNGIVNGGQQANNTLAAVAAPASSTSDAGNLPTVDPSVQASLDKAAADKAAADAAAAKAAEDKKRAAEAAAAKAAAKAAAQAEAAKHDKSSYEKVSARTFKKIVKDADAYKGKKYVVYGVVSQFDSATGDDTFRASVDSTRHSDWYEYNDNAIVTADDSAMLDDVVQDDLVTMYVEVVGSFSYDTQIGGNTTAPQFKVNMIKVTGSSS